MYKHISIVLTHIRHRHRHANQTKPSCILGQNGPSKNYSDHTHTATPVPTSKNTSDLQMEGRNSKLPTIFEFMAIHYREKKANSF